MMLAPAAMVLLAYHYAINATLQSRLTNVRDREKKLVSETASINQDTIAILGRMSQIKREREAIDLQIMQAGEQNAELVQQRDSLSQTYFVASRPAETMQSVIDLIESHNIVCLDNEIDSRGGEDLTAKERKQLADLLSYAPNPGGTTHSHRLVLEGTFKDICRCIQAIKERLPSVAVKSLSLQAADPRTDLRIWVLSLSH